MGGHEGGRGIRVVIGSLEKIGRSGGGIGDVLASVWCAILHEFWWTGVESFADQGTL